MLRALSLASLLLAQTAAAPPLSPTTTKATSGAATGPAASPSAIAPKPALSQATALLPSVPTIVAPTPGKRARLSFTSTVKVTVPAIPAPPPRPAAPPPVLAVGRRLYQQRCAVCHGDEGAADGVGARRLTPEPQHLNAVLWQANVTDDEIARAILLGGAAVSRSPMMPANPDLKTRPDAVQGLVAYVRSLRAPFGSALGSMMLADKSSRAAHGVADKDGNATLVFTNVPAGKAQITVMADGDGTVRCTLDLDVQRDTAVACR